MSSLPKPKARVVSKSNGYYIAAKNNKFKSEQEEIFSDILGEDVDEKIKLSKKLATNQSNHNSKLQEYDSFEKTDTINKVFKELDKRLSADSKRILAQYQQPDYKTLKDLDMNIDLLLDPEVIPSSKKLNFKKREYFKSGNDPRVLNNEVEKEVEERIENLIEKFPKAKTNTALLQYAHTLSKEFLRNKFLEQKHQEFLMKNSLFQEMEQSNLELIKSNNSGSVTTGGLNISLKHPYNKHYKAPKETLDMNAQKYMENNTQIAEDSEITNSVVKDNDVDIKSRTASLCIDDSKCGTVKIGPARESLIESNNTISSNNNNISTIKEGPEEIRSNTTGGSVDSQRQTFYPSTRRQNLGMRNNFAENQARWMRAAHKYRTMYGNNMPVQMMNNSRAESLYSYRSMMNHKMAIRYSQLCLSQEQKPTQGASDLSSNISFLKGSLNGFDPLKNLDMTSSRRSSPMLKASNPLTLPAINTDICLSINTYSNDSAVSTPNTINSAATTLPTPVSTVATSLPSSNGSIVGATSSGSPRRENFVSKKNANQKFKSKLSNSISADDMYRDMAVCKVEDEKPADVNKELSKLEPIIEVTSIMEGRKSVTIRGVEAELLQTTMKSIDGARKSREIQLTRRKSEIHAFEAIKETKKAVDHSKPLGKNLSPPGVIKATDKIVSTGDSTKKLAEAPVIIPKATKSTVSSTITAAPKRIESASAGQKASRSKLSFFKRNKGKKAFKVEEQAPPVPPSPYHHNDEYADINSYDALIDLLTVESIAGTIENKDFLKVDGADGFSRASNASRSTIQKNSALGIIVQHENESSDESSESENDMGSPFSNADSSPNTITSDFGDEYSEIHSSLDFETLNDRECLKAKFKKDMKRSTMLTEYNFFTDEDIELIFDDEKFNKEFITFNRKRKSFDIFETYMMALTKMDIKQ